MMVEVTQADRTKAVLLQKQLNPNTAGHWIRYMREGRLDDHSMVQAFARHRIAVEQRAKLEGARLALEAAALKAAGSLNTVDAHDRIRALDPAKIVGEG